MEEKINDQKQNYEFKAEMKRLLQLLVHSLYTHPEVFLRELISNSSDALNKFRFFRLTAGEYESPAAQLNITINLDKDNNTFSIEDTGIGMTKEELINQIGSIASSGTFEMLDKIKEAKESLDGQLIGQFGVGFYSVFMVTDEVTVETKKAEKGSKAYRWVSTGQDSFTIEEIEKEVRGTKISFKLKDEYKEFAQDYRVEGIINKYSNFVDFPIFLGEKEINTVTALWRKKKDDVKEEELNEFYKFISNDYQKPLGHLHLDVEGNINFKSIVFIPETAPMSLFKDSNEKSLHLYSNRIFIQDDAKELVPDYLRFLKGVVDTDDLPLNVSREVTQSSPVIAKIKNIIAGKILGLLAEWAEKDAEKYDKFFRNFGSLFKIGVNSDFTNKDKIVELLRFESSKTKPGEYTSFNGYVSRMKPEQKDIYYMSGQIRELIEKNPNIEYFIGNDIEVLYLTDPVDIFTIPYLKEYDGKEIKSIDKSDVDISKKEAKADDLSAGNKKTLLERFKSVLGGKVEDVVESKRLVNSPVTLVTGSQAMDPQMEKMMQMMDKNFTASKRILEVNLDHKLLKNISKIFDENSESEVIDKTIVQLYEGAELVEGYMKNPSDFIARMTEFMTAATERK